METDARINSLLDRWEELQEQGAQPSIEELCVDCPELAAELRRRVAALEDMDRLLGTDSAAARARPGDTGTDGVGADRKVPEAMRAEAYYHPERLHATGGLGEVFLARNPELSREVAVKFLKPERARDPKSRRRFLLEAEITSRLEHPGVVPVYNLGADAAGAPCYAMRFIRGETLQEAVDDFHAGERPSRDPSERSLAIRGLLRRFISVCNTVAYAHSRGILHRDVKPQNVILGKYDETMVVDWGLARPFDPGMGHDPMGEETLTPSSGDSGPGTPTVLVVGTPAYMSPEQAEARWDRVGPASDIYSLGATLYAILTGRAPFQGSRIGTVLNQVKRGEFPAPRQVKADVPRALEAICLKAMKLQPEDRYKTALELAADVERYLADEPVTAWREPVWVRSRRWMRRHRTTVTSAVVAVLVALVGTAVVLAVQTQANRALQNSNHALAAANQRERERFDLALEAIKMFHGQVSEDLLLKEKQFDTLRTNLLRGAAGFYDRLDGLLQGQTDPGSLASLGRAYDELGTLTSQIAEKPAALAVHRKALTVRRELAKRADAKLDTRLDVARSLITTGRLLEEMGDTTPALASYQEASGLIEGLPATSQAAQEVQSILGQAHLRTGWLRFHIGKGVEGLASLERARVIFQTLADADPTVSHYQSELASSYNQIGFLLRQSSRPAEALAAMEQARKIFQSLANANPGVIQFQNDLAASHIQLGNLLRQMNRLSEALESYEQARAIFQRLASAYPSVTKFQSDLARSHGNLGILLLRTRRRDEALESLKQARVIQQSLAKANPSVAAFQSDLAITDINLSQIFSRMGRPSDALASLEEARGIQQALVEAHPAVSQFQGELATSLGQIGALYQAAGRVAEAALAYHKGVALLERLPTRSPVDCFNLTCFHARLAGISGLPGSGLSAAEGQAEADKAMSWLRRAIAGGFRNLMVLRTESDFDPLRSRPDFEHLIMDLAFPDDPFAH
jgi:serine/threonine-protein kinase